MNDQSPQPLNHEQFQAAGAAARKRFPMYELTPQTRASIRIVSGSLAFSRETVN
jgi:hypothetical protein